MKKISENDYVLYNTKNKDAVRWESNYNIVIYGDVNEAIEDSKSSKYLTPIKCTSLSQELQDELSNQINKD